MKKKPQQGIALIWVIVAGALLITGIGVITSKKTALKSKGLQPLPPFSFPLSPSPEPVSKQEEPSPSPTISLPPDFLNWLDKNKKQEPLLEILPPKERAELERAIWETQQVLKNIEVFDYKPPNIGDITKGLNQINKQSQEQIQKNMEKQRQEFQQKYQQEIDINKMMERLNQNPPAVPYGGEEKEPSLEEQEYYYRKYILKDPAFQ